MNDKHVHNSKKLWLKASIVMETDLEKYEHNYTEWIACTR